MHPLISVKLLNSPYFRSSYYALYLLDWTVTLKHINLHHLHQVAYHTINQTLTLYTVLYNALLCLTLRNLQPKNGPLFLSFWILEWPEYGTQMQHNLYLQRFCFIFYFEQVYLFDLFSTKRHTSLMHALKVFRSHCNMLRNLNHCTPHVCLTSFVGVYTSWRPVVGSASEQQRT